MTTVRASLLTLSVVLMAQVAHANDFTNTNIFEVGQLFDVSFERAPGTNTVTLPLIEGQEFCIISDCSEADLANPPMTLNISVVPAGPGTNGAEWLVFDFQVFGVNFTSQGAIPVSNGQNFPWTIEEVGLKTLVPAEIIGDFTQFLDLNGNPFVEKRVGGLPEPNESIFGNPIVNNPIPGMTGNGELSSPDIMLTSGVGELLVGSHVDDFGDVNLAVNSDSEAGFIEAYEFMPLLATIPTAPETSTWIMSLMGFGLLGLLGLYRKTS